MRTRSGGEPFGGKCSKFDVVPTMTLHALRLAVAVGVLAEQPGDEIQPDDG